MLGRNYALILLVSVCVIAALFGVAAYAFHRIEVVKLATPALKDKQTQFTTDMALDAFTSAGSSRDNERFLMSLASGPRKVIEAALTLNDTCAESDWVLDVAFKKAFGPDPEIVPRHCALNIKNFLAFRSGEFQVTEEVVNGNEVTYKGRLKHHLETTGEGKEITLTLVDEGAGWRVIPPNLDDYVSCQDTIVRCIKVKTQLAAEVEAGAFKSPQEAMQALSRRLRRGIAAPGTPDEALEIYEATQLAGDYDGYVGVQSNEVQAFFRMMVELSRRDDAAMKAYYGEMEARFGPQPNLDFVMKKFDPASIYFHGVTEMVVVGRELVNPSEDRFQVRETIHLEGGTVKRDWTLLVKREPEGWRIEWPPSKGTDPVALIGKLEKSFKPRTDMMETLAADIKSGKYATLAEAKAAYRAASGRLYEKRDQEK